MAQSHHGAHVIASVRRTASFCSGLCTCQTRSGVRSIPKATKKKSISWHKSEFKSSERRHELVLESTDTSGGRVRLILTLDVFSFLIPADLFCVLFILARRQLTDSAAMVGLERLSSRVVQHGRRQKVGQKDLLGQPEMVT